MFAQADEDVKNSLLYKVSRKVYNGELIPPESGNFVSDQNLFNYQAKVLKELSERESYVVVGRQIISSEIMPMRSLCICMRPKKNVCGMRWSTWDIHRGRQ